MKLLDMTVVNSYSYSGTSAGKHVSITATDRITMIRVTGTVFFVKSMNGLKHLERWFP